MNLRRVLVVAPNKLVARRVVGWASSEEHQALVWTDFAEAKPELEARPPDLLVTELKVGAYKGLHLAMRAQSGGLHTPTIIIGEPDAALEAEAHQLHAQYISQPIEGGAFAETARAILGA
jgi:DNA-binding response OmpR family regulator